MWIITIVNVVGFFAWLTAQWYKQFAFVCNLAFPGILLAIWLIPINLALSVASLDDDHRAQIQATYVCAVIVSIVKPTGVPLAMIGIRVAKDKYTGEYTGAG